MQSDPLLDRRSVLRAAGTLSVAALAGCTGQEEGGDDGPDYETVPSEEEPDYGGWLDSARTYDGTADLRGESEVTVMVGTGSRGRSFSPAAIMVDPGTTVVWEWTGDGGGHNVAEENEAYESPIETEEGYTFEHAFEEPGVSRYTCIPHDAQGMRGAVAIAE
ncbi:halocyanin domain-containing protein [Halalkalicoccus jeotgali]|uniref:Halocyanin domain protein n=1 Tax=Halalkalicoccus jeotgali (strain DSM 18796 / CECT 7217 / JCM 14584 / KCTC 4019 / B3) TaxID=795797 RepID=D8J3X4_HALJB|nr:halocyanin domain-containing protein [Halalkalicoccus jeotgali]ADJ15366.1 halocyanin domain protein [Halalkalicoccus jeotgali B3]ELY35421.1 halocyanin domain-containing protein [Halalkalicoccus jeotgali B3]